MTALLISMLFLQTGEITLPYEPGEMIQDTTTVTGIFAGYSLGDYYHPVFLLESGEMVSVWAPRRDKPGLDVFMFLHRWELMDVKVVDIITEIPEAGGEIPVPTVVDAFAGGESWRDWCDTTCEELGLVTVEDYHEHFGDPTVTEELFDEWAYANGPEDE